MWYDHDMNGWGYAGMGLGMLLFWGLLIAGLIVLIRFAVADRDRTPRSEPPRAEDVLAQRFARGEIDAQEYADRLATLRTHIAPR
ncbi:SHOCT domain-containing protein [Nocardia huaxiensis]|uniref:SHOCT domain-containing protein n=1 Tax=Nocardia huaxiensis TaxID=2755382 RepID=A0A7D6VEP5_9NOCA|nr:SHOCT domain-containing protein [Nocardia huaxiensis]QLY34652.1 SHOCT domain-containing protein [Nocardia huaxiensis]UFS99899.1 SHOCT domain-containing protein [Nocardia huaxiensis]